MIKLVAAVIFNGFLLSQEGHSQSKKVLHNLAVSGRGAMSSPSTLIQLERRKAMETETIDDELVDFQKQKKCLLEAKSLSDLDHCAAERLKMQTHRVSAMEKRDEMSLIQVGNGSTKVGELRLKALERRRESSGEDKSNQKH